MKLKARTYRFIHLISALAIISGLYLGYTIYCSNYIGVYNGLRDRVGYNAVVDNYEEAVEIAADEFDLPYGYLMALIQLERGGNIPAGSRFERHVFRRLKNVRDGKRNRYENVRGIIFSVKHYIVFHHHSVFSLYSLLGNNYFLLNL